MESLTRLVTESLARHGFDRPLDYRRLRWSRWFRCESHHSLLLVPSKPGVFALAEEIIDLDSSKNHGEKGTLASENSARPRRMLAVTEFFEADDMAFVLDRMLARPNPMRDALNSGRYFIRFVIIEDESQRRSVCNSLNQWVARQSMINQATIDQSITDPMEKVTGIASHFASLLELTPATEYIPAAQASLFENSGVGRTLASANTGIKNPIHTEEIRAQTSIAAQQLDAGAATNIHCPSPFPSGF